MDTPDFVWQVTSETTVSPNSDACTLVARFDLREPIACPDEP
jgi:hypothetical protein